VTQGLLTSMFNRRHLVGSVEPVVLFVDSIAT
jgi:hypothetical protein